MNKKIIIIFSPLLLITVIFYVWFFYKDAEDIAINSQQIDKYGQNQSTSQEYQEQHVNNEINQKEDSQNDQTVDLDDGWQSYEHEGWKYTIKYPSELFIKENAQGDAFPGDTSTCPMCGFGGQTLIISDIQEMGVHDVGTDETIHIRISTHKKSADETLDDFIERGKGEQRVYVDTVVDGRNAVKTTHLENSNDNSNEYVNEHPMHSLNISIDDGEWFYMLYAEYASLDDYALITKIFDTFTFTE